MNLFVYGTLLVPRIWKAVTRLGDTVSLPAALPGYEIHRVRGDVYPAVVSAPGTTSTVPGRVHFDLPDTALRRLDAYETSFYERRELRVETRELGPVAAHVYCVRDEDAPTLLDADSWTLEWFEANALEEYWKRLFAR